MKTRFKLYSLLLTASFAGSVYAQGAAVIRGEISPGNYGNYKTDANGNMYVVTGTPGGGTSATGSSQSTFLSTLNSVCRYLLTKHQLQMVYRFNSLVIM